MNSFAGSKSLPGFGKQKAQIFAALLGKQLGVKPEGWENATGDYSLPGYRSVADVVDEASLHEVRAFKKAKKSGVKQGLMCLLAFGRVPGSWYFHKDMSE
ncbi:MAG: hypothetical protein V9G13_05445 [Marmoricola sp.]